MLTNFSAAANEIFWPERSRTSTPAAAKLVAEKLLALSCEGLDTKILMVLLTGKLKPDEMKLLA